MCICTDSRCPETFNTLALLGAEFILIWCNTLLEFQEINQFVSMQNLLCLQGVAYQNSRWINSVTKAGLEEGVEKLGESTILFTY
jgi:hypothetical protein